MFYDWRLADGRRPLGDRVRVPRPELLRLFAPVVHISPHPVHDPDPEFDPLGDSLAASAPLAALPVVVLLGLPTSFHVRAHWAALAGLSAVLVAAVVVYHMPPRLGLEAAAYGALYGLLPIGWIVFNVVCLHPISVRTGQFDMVKQSIAGLSGGRSRFVIYALRFAGQVTVSPPTASPQSILQIFPCASPLPISASAPPARSSRPPSSRRTCPWPRLAPPSCAAAATP